MNNIFSITSAAAIAMLFAISSCSTQDEKVSKPAAAPSAKAEAKAAPAKAKAEKASGDIGLIDTEKNYMILVTKQGKLVTLDFDQKTKVTKLTPTPAKMGDVGLGNSATVTYTKQNNKNIASGVEYKAKK
ncbi:MAG: hypothetical protein GEU77_06540 [Deltaproteobacteria bacterium]|nr:hypothetical protein [Deltaproteobacteria bacterium]